MSYLVQKSKSFSVKKTKSSILMNHYIYSQYYMLGLHQPLSGKSYAEIFGANSTYISRMVEFNPWGHMGEFSQESNWEVKKFCIWRLQRALTLPTLPTFSTMVEFNPWGRVGEFSQESNQEVKKLCMRQVHTSFVSLTGQASHLWGLSISETKISCAQRMRYLLIKKYNTNDVF